MNIKSLIDDAKALRAKIQQAVEEGEHIFETAKGEIHTGQLVNAAGAAGMLVTNLEGHAAAADKITAVGSPIPVPAAAPAVPSPEAVTNAIFESLKREGEAEEREMTLAKEIEAAAKKP